MNTGELTREQIDSVFYRQTVGRIGCHAAGRTYIVPITYAYDGEFIYCHSLPGMKISMMRENPNICFEVEEVENKRDWRTVIAWGTYHELEGEAAAKAIRLLIKQNIPYLTNQIVTPTGKHRTHQPKESPVLFRIRVIDCTGRFERY